MHTKKLLKTNQKYISLNYEDIVSKKKDRQKLLYINKQLMQLGLNVISNKDMPKNIKIKLTKQNKNLDIRNNILNYSGFLQEVNKRVSLLDGKVLQELIL